MKKNICWFILLLLLNSISKNSSSQNYLSLFGDTSTTWNIIPFGACDAICSQSITTVGDTTIGLNSYKIIVGLDGYLREDTIQGKAWFYDTTYATEFLVMDLSLNFSDTFLIYDYTGTAIPLIVDSVYYLGGLKHVRLNCWISMCGFIEKITFVEGSGTNASVHYQRNFDGYSVNSYMLCHYKNGGKVAGNYFFNDTCDVCMVGFDEFNEPSKTIKVYPNPSRDNIFIELTEVPERTTLFLIDELGNVVLNKQAEVRNMINTKDFANGIYLLQIRSGNTILNGEKIIIQH